MGNIPWWKRSVVYEIYVRSFFDSNGDGIGDLAGVTEKLDYLKDLGVDVLWLTPIYESPGDDNGYDISDYYSIMDLFGTMEDFKTLLTCAHERGLRIVMDLVVNHTSDEHAWFLESRKSAENPYRDYYIWRDGKEAADGEMTPPNNWSSSFSGSAWQYDSAAGQYYLHLFGRKQPDLNWDHEPVREEIFRMMRWWLDLGIDGFRMDVISLISKDPGAFLRDSAIRGHSVCANGPRIHEYLREMRRRALAGYDVMTVGETPAVTISEAKRYAAADQSELDMVFQFELMDVDGGESGKWNDTRYRLSDVKRVLGKWQKGLYGAAWNSLFWNNHDQPRAVSRFGDTSSRLFWNKSAKMLATALYFLQGTPYLYQGEELGMTNAGFESLSDYRDIESLGAYEELVSQKKLVSHADMMRYLKKSSRDNARTPMQWDDGPFAGFSRARPWIGVNENYTWLNVRAQAADPDSVLHYYKRLIRILREDPIVCEGGYEDLDKDSEALYLYTRSSKEGRIWVFSNFSDKEQRLDEEIVPREARCLIGNYDGHQRGILRAYECIAYEYVTIHGTA